MATTLDAPQSTVRSAKAKSSTKVWALDNVDAPVRTKPRRPYTPYNLFYLLERELVVQGQDPAAAKDKVIKRAAMLAEQHGDIGKRLEDDIHIPARYEGIILLPMWYEPNLKEKRKHRKTHGMISFKDLTAIISKNWAAIDKETKDYCTKISEMGRKRYKETMVRYNASQKILQLKKEHAAMESAREEMMLEEPFKTNKKKKACGSPPRPGKGSTGPATPDRISSQNNVPIVSPSHSAYSNQPTPVHVPSSAAPPTTPSFYNYGPPPPLPPPMPSHSSQPMMQGQQVHRPPTSMPMYHQHQHHHPHQQHRYNYRQAQAHAQVQALNKRMNSHVGHNQAVKVHNAGHYEHHQQQRSSGGGNFMASNILTPQHGGANVSVNVNVHIKGEPSPPVHVAARGTHQRVTTTTTQATETKSSSSMTHDEAMRLCTLMKSPGESQGNNQGSNRNNQYEAPPPLNDALLQGMPSFDFADHHSLSTEDGLDFLDDHVGNHEDHILDLIGINVHDDDHEFLSL